MYGWAGLILKVDLTRRKIVKQKLPKDLAKRFLGGAGINTKILYDLVQPKVSPYDPENALIYGASPLNGTLAPSSSRLTITSKGPYTMGFSDSNSGGHFAPELKFAGYDHIVFRGRANKPVYLWIDDEHVELRSANHMWGKDVWETDKMLKEELRDPGIKTSVIGPAGERLVRFAAIINDRTRAAGWGGIGPVMGSKNLKAVAVRGTKGVRIARPEEFEKACLKARKMIRESYVMLTIGVYGKTYLNDRNQSIINPVRNYREDRVPEDAFPLMSKDHFLKFVIRSLGCFNCPVACSHYLGVESGRWAGERGEGYEVHQQVDAQRMGIYDPGFVLKWTNETNRLGSDCDGPAFAIAWAMDCYERGIITDRDTDGIELTFGNQEAALDMLCKIVQRSGFGDILAEGNKLASEKIGRGSEKYAYHSKGKFTLLDPRRGWIEALASATSTRGSDHLKGLPMSDAWLKWTGKRNFKVFDARTDTTYVPELVIFCENLYAVIHSLGLCINVTWAQNSEGPGLPEFAEILSAATGVSFTKEILLKTGERIYNVEKAFNSKCGLTRLDDNHHDFFFENRAPHAPIALDRETFEKLKDRYYELREWNVKTGHPTKGKLRELGLAKVADDLERSGIL
jgi:aldehyde:ferredoxin oxidoreductase